MSAGLKLAAALTAGLLAAPASARAHEPSGCETQRCVKSLRAKRVDRERMEIRRLTPYRSPDGRRWAIPWRVVYCESRGRWGAWNPSGALGPYQLLGWGAPWPVRTVADKLAHHRIAARLWHSRPSAWVCA